VSKKDDLIAKLLEIADGGGEDHRQVCQDAADTIIGVMSAVAKLKAEIERLKTSLALAGLEHECPVCGSRIGSCDPGMPPCPVADARR